MILTVTLNPALDITYRVPAMRRGASHRVADHRERAGGKGLNVSRVLHLMGHGTRAAGLAGGPAGRAVLAELSATGIAHSFTRIDAPTRRTLTIVDDQGSATAFNENGPRITETEWTRFRHDLATLLDSADVLVLSGSVPPGLPADAYGSLLAAAQRCGIPTVLDADGPALLAALPAGPAVIKPNADELLAAGLAGDVPWDTLLRQAVAWSAAAVAEPLAGTVDPDVVHRHLRHLPEPEPWSGKEHPS